MLSSLPNRPLYKKEVDALTESDSLDLVFPASPESIREDDDGHQRVHDLLMFMGERTAAIAYTDDGNGWTLVTRETDETDDAWEVAYDKLLEYRGYEALDREEAMKQAVAKLAGLPEDEIDRPSE